MHATPEIARLELPLKESGHPHMGQLIYSMLVSLDGYVADPHGDFTWAQPNEDALTAINDDMANVGTYLYGRRMYELMSVWETDLGLANSSPESARFANTWQATKKIVYSQKLNTPYTDHTELVRQFCPTEMIALKQSSDQDLTIDGPTVAATAFRHDLVDQVIVLVCPVTVGSGLAFWPSQRLNLRLRQMERFEHGVVYLKYQVHPRLT